MDLSNLIFGGLYIYECLENTQAWSSYYSNKDEYNYKCSAKNCSARLKVAMEKPKEEEKEEEKNGDIGLNSQMLQKRLELKIPTLKNLFKRKTWESRK